MTKPFKQGRWWANCYSAGIMTRPAGGIYFDSEPRSEHDLPLDGENYEEAMKDLDLIVYQDEENFLRFK